MNKDFCVFIMVHGRPDKMWTYQTLRNHGYTGKIYLLADNLDKSVEDYKNLYKDKLIVFDKKKASLKTDSGDNSGDLRGTIFASNVVFDIARKNNFKYFCLMCDDYRAFEYRKIEKDKLLVKKIKNLDNVFKSLLKFLKNTKTHTIAFAQGGDFIGGAENKFAIDGGLKRKAMNSFICSVDRPFKFMGRMNEDVSTYINLGSKGYLFFTTHLASLVQKPTQLHKGGMTELYLDNGTYTKSFFSILYNPSCIKIAMMNTSHKRIHHSIKWINAVPKILSEKFKKT